MCKAGTDVPQKTAVMASDRIKYGIDAGGRIQSAHHICVQTWTSHQRKHFKNDKIGRMCFSQDSQDILVLLHQHAPC